MRKKKSKWKYDNIALVICSILAVLLIGISCVLTVGIFKDLKGTKEAKVVANIEKYDYQLTERNTKYYKSLFNQLKELLNEESVDEEEYAKLVSQLFVTDFYDLESKLDKTDVGGVQYVWEDYRETFKNFATDNTGIYYYLENNVDGKRKQSLPTVTEVTVDSISPIQYSKGKVSDDKAYEVKVTITYKKNLGYPQQCVLKLIHNGDKLEVAEMK